MAKKKKEQKVSISQGDEAQARAVLEQYHKLAGKLRSSEDQKQAEEALSIVSDLPEAAQMALLKALSREYHQDAADVLVGINALSPLKSVRKEARRLIKEALAVNERFGTPIYKDFRASLPLVNKLILENPDIVDEDEEEEEEEDEAE